MYSQISIVNCCLAKLHIEISMDHKLKVQLCSMYVHILCIVTTYPAINILCDGHVRLTIIMFPLLNAMSKCFQLMFGCKSKSQMFSLTEIYK